MVRIRASGSITNRHWIFGDGNTLDTTLISVSYTYALAGTNLVTFAVSRSGGTAANSSSNFIIATKVMPPLFSRFSSDGINLFIQGIRTPTATYGLLSWTNLLLPPSGIAATGIFDSASVTSTNAILIQPANHALFFRLVSPYP